MPACYALENCERGLKISRWNNLYHRIYFDATEKRRIKVTRISDVLSVWGTRIKRLDEFN